MLEPSASPTLLSAGWCLYFTKSSDVHTLFNWSRTIGQLAAEKFTVGAYLECVDPTSGGDVICLAQIKARVEHLVFLELMYLRRRSRRGDGQQQQQQLFVFTVDSCDLFPLGWAEMNNFYSDRQELYREYFCFDGQADDDDVNNQCEMDEYFRKTKPNFPSPLANIKARNWCPAIYLNMVMNCGPYLKRPKLELLPKYFGPGPLVLVLQKVNSVTSISSVLSCKLYI